MVDIVDLLILAFVIQAGVAQTVRKVCSVLKSTIELIYIHTAILVLSYTYLNINTLIIYVH